MDKKTIVWVFCTGILQTGNLYAVEAPPSIEFLEYLSDIETSSGEWLDPLEMKEIASNEQTDESERDHRDE
jgi:hypothetical protein